MLAVSKRISCRSAVSTYQLFGCAQRSGSGLLQQRRRVRRLCRGDWSVQSRVTAAESAADGESSDTCAAVFDHFDSSPEIIHFDVLDSRRPDSTLNDVATFQ